MSIHPGMRIHLIGIGGTGLSAIARLLLERGCQVSGSDRQDSPLAQAVRLAGARVLLGHAAENVQGAELVIRSSAIGDDNPEVLQARRLGIPVLKRADFLGELMTGMVGIAVAGTHGKTTTTAMLAWVLSQLGQDPTFIIGGIAKDLGVNARSGKGAHFVIEADEYDRMFHGLKPTIAVVTNIEHDHPDCYPTAEEFYQAFTTFANLLPAAGTLVACADDPQAQQLAQEMGSSVQVRTYGFAPAAYMRGEALSPNAAGGFDFTARWDGQALPVSLQVPGQHNVQNALAVLCVAHVLGLSLPEAARALGGFSGAGRRFDVLGEAAGITVIDDYGHHPTEVRLTLAAARSRYPGRTLWAVWQPHTYSRTRQLQQAFVLAFEQADHVLVTDIYASRESVPEDGFSAAQVVAAMRHPHARYIPSLAANTAYLSQHLQPGDVVIVFSAGDADQISAQVLQALKERNQAHV